MLPRHIRTDGFVAPCIPILAHTPSGSDWVHEIKHDGYRLIVRRDGAAVRLFTRRGCDWTDRYPAIAAAAAKLRARSFTLDGEAVVCGADGIAVFYALHRHGRVSDAILQTFDLLELNGEDFRPLLLRKRKTRLIRLLANVRNAARPWAFPFSERECARYVPGSWSNRRLRLQEGGTNRRGA